MADILIAGATSLLPVARLLPSHRFLSVEPIGPAVLKTAGLAACHISDWADPNLEAEAGWRAHLILDGVAGARPDSGLDPDLLALITPALPNPAMETLRQLVGLVLLLDKVKPGLCLVDNDIQPSCRAAALWARARGVPCLHVPHAVYQLINRAEPGKDVHDLLTASHLAAAGPYQYEWYARLGFPAERMRVTGSPRLDAWAAGLNGLDRATARRALGLDGERPVVTYAATWGQHTSLFGFEGYHHEANDSYIAFLEAVKGKGWQVIVKLHPHSADHHQEWHAEMARRLEVPVQFERERLAETLIASHLVMGYGGSNLLLEAACIPGLHLVSVLGYEGQPAVTVTHQVDPGHYRALLATCLARPAPDTAHLLAEFAGPHDGEAAPRVAEWITELL